MLYFNEDEINMYVDRYRNQPVLGRAAKFLQDWRDVVNQNSDGWAYWKQGAQAARQLMELLLSAAKEQFAADAGITEAQLRKALGPIKACCTRRKLPCPTLEPPKSDKSQFTEPELPKNSKPADFRKTWDLIAAKLLQGRTIKQVRYMSKEECRAQAWDSAAVVLFLDDGTAVTVSTDDEGNGPGALFVDLPDGSSETLPVIPSGR